MGKKVHRLFFTDSNTQQYISSTVVYSDCIENMWT